MIFLAGVLVGTFIGVSIMCLMQVNRVNENAWLVELAKAVLWSINTEYCWVESYLPEVVGSKMHTIIYETDIDKLLDAYRDRDLQQ